MYFASISSLEKNTGSLPSQYETATIFVLFVLRQGNQEQFEGAIRRSQYRLVSADIGMRI